MKRGKEKSTRLTLIVIFFILVAYLILSPFSRFITLIPDSFSRVIEIFDYLLGAGIVIFFFTKHSILSFREIYAAVKESKFAKGFLIMLFTFFIASVFSYLLLRGVSLIWGTITTLIAGLLLGSFIFYYVKYLSLSLNYSKEKIEKEFKVRKTKNFILFSSLISLLFAIPAIIFLLNLSVGLMYLVFSLLSWIVFIIGIVNYVRYVRLVRKK